MSTDVYVWATCPERNESVFLCVPYGIQGRVSIVMEQLSGQTRDKLVVNYIKEDDLPMSMTRPDYTFMAEAMKNILDAQETEAERHKCRIAFKALANQYGMAYSKYGNFNFKKFCKAAGLE